MHFPPVSVTSLNSDELATADIKGNVDVSSRRDGSISRVFPGSVGLVQCVAIRPGSGTLVMGCQGGAIRLRELIDEGEVFTLKKNFDLTALKKLSLQQRHQLIPIPKKQTLTLSQALKVDVLKVLFSPNGTYMAAFYLEPDWKYYLRVWQVVGEQWTRIHEVLLKMEKPKLGRPHFPEDRQPCIGWHRCALSPDGKSIASSNKQGLCILKLAKNHYRVVPLETVSAIAYSPDGKLIACGTAEGAVRFISVKKKQQQMIAVKCHSKAITAIAFKPDESKKYVTAGRDRKIIFRDIDASLPLANLRLPQEVESLTWERHAHGVSSLIASGQSMLFYFEVSDAASFAVRLLWKSGISPTAGISTQKRSVEKHSKGSKKEKDSTASESMNASSEGSSETEGTVEEKEPIQTSPPRSGSSKLKSSEAGGIKRDAQKSADSEEDKPKSSAVATPVQTSPSLLPPVVPKAQLSSFPTSALQKILTFVNEIDLQALLVQTAKGEKTFLFSLLRSYFNTASPVTDMIAANLTISNILFFSKMALTKAGFSTVAQMIADAYNGKDISTKKYGGKTEGILEAIEVLRTYFNQFYVLHQSAPQLDQQALVLALLKDRDLHQLLKDPKILAQLSDICLAAHVPRFGKKEAEKSLILFRKAQELVYTLPEFEKIAAYADLMPLLIGLKTEDTIELLQELLPLLKQLEKVVQAYVLPLSLPIQRLALPHIGKLLRGVPMRRFYLNPAFGGQGKREWTDAKAMFESFRSTEGGALLYTPVAVHIHERNLGHFTFSGEGKMSIQGIEEDFPNVKNGELFFGYAFESFSFKGSRFKDIRFRAMYFENCDFTDAGFEGSLSFSEVFIDARTAKTLLPALSRALRTGKCTIDSQQGIILISLPDKEKNVPQAIPKQISQYILTDFATWLDPDSSGSAKPSSPRLRQTPSSSDLTQSGETEFDSCEEAPDFERGLVVSVDLEELDESSKKCFSSSPKEMVQTLVAEHEQEIEQLQQALSRLNLELRERVGKGLQEQQGELEALQHRITAIEKSQKIKAAVRLERDSLLNHPRKEIARFYQTFLTGMVRNLLALTLLGSKIKLLSSSEGIATKISNRQRKKGIEKALAENPKFIERALGVLSAAKDYAIEGAGYLKPLTQFVPKAGGALSAVIDHVTARNEETKFQISADALDGLTVKDLERIADALARKITLAYEEQILLLTGKGAVRFAECGVFRGVASLLNGYGVSGDLEASLWLAIRKIKVHQNGRKLLGLLEIPFTQKPLQVKDPNVGPLTEDRLYRKCGIRCADKFYSNDRKGQDGAKPLQECATTYASQVGYMSVSRAEWKKHFRHAVTADHQRRGPMGVSSGKAAPPAPATSTPQISKGTKRSQKSEKEKKEPVDLETLQKFNEQRFKLIEETYVKRGAYVSGDALIAEHRQSVQKELQKLIAAQIKVTIACEQKKLTIVLQSDDSSADYRSLKESLMVHFSEIITDNELFGDRLILTFRYSQDANEMKTFLEQLLNLSY